MLLFLVCVGRVCTKVFDSNVHDCGRKEEASMVFDEMGNRGVVSWNTMIAGLYH